MTIRKIIWSFKGNYRILILSFSNKHGLQDQNNCTHRTFVFAYSQEPIISGKDYDDLD